MDTADILNIFQVLLSLLVIGAVLLQVKGAGLGNIFGGGGETFHTRRGVEQTLFRATIVLMTLFVAVSIAAVRV